MNAELFAQKIKEDQGLAQEGFSQIDQSTSAGQLLVKMLEDKDFAEKIMSQEEMEGIMKIAGQVGLSITEDDIHEANKTLAWMAGNSNPPANGELSEEDLENVAGGTFLATMLSIAATVTISVSLASLASVLMSSADADEDKHGK